MFPTSELFYLPHDFTTITSHLPGFQGRMEREECESGPLAPPFDPACSQLCLLSQWITGTQTVRQMESRRERSWSSELEKGTESCSLGFQTAFLPQRVCVGEQADPRDPQLPPEQLHLQLPHTQGSGIYTARGDSRLRKVWKPLGMEQSPRCQVP